MLRLINGRKDTADYKVLYIAECKKNQILATLVQNVCGKICDLGRDTACDFSRMALEINDTLKELK